MKMKPLSLKKIAQVTGGKLIGDPALADKNVAGVVRDTSQIEKDYLFVSIKGARYDGHDFCQQALDNGALACLCEKEVSINGPYVLVNSTLEAMKALGEYYRSLFDIPVIGITGSVGKTTTKEMTHAVMSAKYKTLKNEGNLNNEIGVPLTLFRLDDSYEAAVIEMGMSDFGEISRITAAVKPDVAVISNIGVSHIENLGSREGILKAKLEILESMKADAPVILNGDDDMLATACAGAHPVTYYGIENENCKFKAIEITSKESGTDLAVGFIGGSARVSLPYSGRHNVYNSLAAVAAGSFFGIEVETALEALKNYVPAGMRQRINKKFGITFIEDCYNASPDSQAAALSVLGEMKAERRIAVIGDMLELGAVSEKSHYDVGVKAAENGIDILCTYGERSLLAAKAAAENGVKEVYNFDDKEKLSAHLAALIKENDAVLFKASRGMKLEDVIYSVYSYLEKE